MRTLAFITLALIALSCSDKDAGPEPDYFMTAEKDGESWSATPYVSFSPVAPDTLYIGGMGTDIEDGLSMHIKFDGPGEYVLVKELGRYYRTLGGDIIIDAYKLDASTDAGTLTITHYDANKRIIEGNFSLTLKRDKHFAGDETQLMTFTRGSFRGKIDR